MPAPASPKRIAIIYDCLFPWTIGGAERWYRTLAEQLAAQGHDVTYLTLRQWAMNQPPAIPGVRVKSVGPRMALYHDGRRRILPPLVFGIGIFWHLLWHGRRYDRLHMASFPFFSMLAAGVLRPLHRYRIAADWLEVWGRDYWRSYLGRAGAIGAWIERLCAKVPHDAYSLSNLHAARVTALGHGGPVTVLTGLSDLGNKQPHLPAADPPTLVYAGRMIPEKNVPLLVDALAKVMANDTQVRAILCGRGPDYDTVVARVAALGLADRIATPGFVDQADLDLWMSSAIAVVQPSRREGYGLVVVEAAARGVPVVLVAGDDNAATELVDDGVNGWIAGNATADALADALCTALRDGAAARQTTRAWFDANRARLSVAHSVDIVSASL